MRNLLDRGDRNAAREQRVEGTLVRRRRHARHLGYANTFSADCHQVRKRTSNLDADPHETASPTTRPRCLCASAGRRTTPPLAWQHNVLPSRATIASSSGKPGAWWAEVPQKKRASQVGAAPSATLGGERLTCGKAAGVLGRKGEP